VTFSIKNYKKLWSVFRFNQSHHRLMIPSSHCPLPFGQQLELEVILVASTPFAILVGS